MQTYLLYGVKFDCHFSISFKEYNCLMAYSANNFGGYRNQIDSVRVSFTYCQVWQMIQYPHAIFISKGKGYTT